GSCAAKQGGHCGQFLPCHGFSAAASPPVRDDPANSVRDDLRPLKTPSPANLRRNVVPTSPPRNSRTGRLPTTFHLISCHAVGRNVVPAPLPSEPAWIVPNGQSLFRPFSVYNVRQGFV